VEHGLKGGVEAGVGAQGLDEGVGGVDVAVDVEGAEGVEAGLEQAVDVGGGEGGARAVLVGAEGEDELASVAARDADDGGAVAAIDAGHAAVVEERAEADAADVAGVADVGADGVLVQDRGGDASEGGGGQRAQGGAAGEDLWVAADGEARGAPSLDAAAEDRGELAASGLKAQGEGGGGLVVGEGHEHEGLFGLRLGKQRVPVLLGEPVAVGDVAEGADHGLAVAQVDHAHKPPLAADIVRE
jgi:hypothetical protein